MSFIKVIGTSGGVFYVDVQTVAPSVNWNKASYENVPINFITVNDTMDLTTSTCTLYSIS